MEETRIVWMNGNLVPGSKANVPLLSHSFSRGSAIFETFGVHKGTSGPVVFRMDQHLKRLKNSALTCIHLLCIHACIMGGIKINIKNQALFMILSHLVVILKTK